jgi:DTW domain-containing protein YfiP
LGVNFFVKVMNIFLLTHQRELNKKTNTGSLVVDVLGEKAHLVVWDRVIPDPVLLKNISEGSIALLYPSIASQSVSEVPDYQNYIIIDGTWQEAQKIYNRSPYLKGSPTIEILTNKPSAYNLRRNQREGCLCTAECAIEILKSRDFSMMANDLQTMFAQHLVSQS